MQVCKLALFRVIFACVGYAVALHDLKIVCLRLVWRYTAWVTVNTGRETSLSLSKMVACMYICALVCGKFEASNDILLKTIRPCLSLSLSLFLPSIHSPPSPPHPLSLSLSLSPSPPHHPLSIWLSLSLRMCFCLYIKSLRAVTLSYLKFLKLQNLTVVKELLNLNFCHLSSLLPLLFLC